MAAKKSPGTRTTKPKTGGRGETKHPVYSSLIGDAEKAGLANIIQATGVRALWEGAFSRVDDLFDYIQRCGADEQRKLWSLYNELSVAIITGPRALREFHSGKWEIGLTGARVRRVLTFVESRSPMNRVSAARALRLSGELLQARVTALDPHGANVSRVVAFEIVGEATDGPLTANAIKTRVTKSNSLGCNDFFDSIVDSDDLGLASVALSVRKKMELVVPPRPQK